MARPKRALDQITSEDRFRALALEAATLGRQDGLDFTSFHDPKLPHFNKLNAAGQAGALDKLGTLVQLAHELHASGSALTDGKKLIWAFLRIVKMTPSSDLLDRIEREDMIDIYNEQHQMIFASPAFLNLLSYSLEDVYCRPWIEIFGKDEGVLAATIQAIVGILDGRNKKVVDLSDLPESEGYEIDSPFQRRCMTKPRFIAPLFERGRAAAYLCSNRIRLLKP